MLRPAISSGHDNGTGGNVNGEETINGTQAANQVAQRNAIDAGLDVADANAIEVDFIS